MTWQDVVIALSYVCFSLALIPSIKSKDKPALKTSLTTATLNVIVALTQMTLGLWFSALAGLAVASLWFLLAYQKHHQ